MKKCKCCKLQKDECNFRYSPITGSGLTTKCIDCLRKESLVFEKRSKLIHGDKYKYNTLDDYSGNRIIVQIYCTVHNTTFPQRPFAHIKGQGCPICGQEDRIKTTTKTIDQFILDSIKIHGDVYDYKDTVYSGAFCNVTILCNKEGHGNFNLLANNHLAGNGCQLCSKETASLGNERFISESKEYYGEDAFDYSKVNYVNNTTKVSMKCNLHEEWFDVAPMFHRDPLKNSGCKYCGKLSSNRWTIESILRIPNIEKKVGYIYIGQIDTLPSNHYKIGITQDLKSRMSCYRMDLEEEGVFKYLHHRKDEYLTCARIEATFKKFLREFHTKATIDFGGKNEVFSLDSNYLCFAKDIVMGKYDFQIKPHLDKIVTNSFDIGFIYDLYEQVKVNYEDQ